jgi:hypothetical protein
MELKNEIKKFKLTFLKKILNNFEEKMKKVKIDQEIYNKNIEYIKKLNKNLTITNNQNKIEINKLNSRLNTYFLDNENLKNNLYELKNSNQKTINSDHTGTITNEFHNHEINLKNLKIGKNYKKCLIKKQN